MKAILIDAKERTVKQVVLPENQRRKVMHQMMECDLFQYVARFHPYNDEREDVLYCDDNGLSKKEVHKFNIKFEDRHVFAVPGKSLLVGNDGAGDAIDVHSTPGLVNSCIEWGVL